MGVARGYRNPFQGHRRQRDVSERQLKRTSTPPPKSGARGGIDGPRNMRMLGVISRGRQLSIIIFRTACV